MKYLLAISILCTGYSAAATIDGPSCGDLTGDQVGYLSQAAMSYVETDKSTDDEETVFVPGSLKLSEVDCHDYDGVHSSTEFIATWKQTVEIEGQKIVQTCEQEYGVSVDYDQAKKLKTISEDSEFSVEEVDEAFCE